MNKNGHLACSSAAGALVGVLAGAPPLVVLACAGVGGAAGWAPDIDAHNSTATTALGIVGKPVHKAVAGTSNAVYTATKTREDTAAAGGKHRGLTHTLVCALAAGAAVLAVLLHVGLVRETALAVAAAVSGGWGMHLGCDALTKNGVPAFWPLSIAGERWYGVSVPSLLAIKGGGPAEKVLSLVAWLATATLLVLSTADWAGLVDLPEVAPELPV
ncbi:metal-dependent hydrolase [Salinifilum ghardaiensis]